MEYFSLLYRLHTEERYLIWMSDEQDSVLVHAGGFVPSFGSLASLREYAALNDYTLRDEEPRLHDLDWIATWVAQTDAPVDCIRTLNVWNLFVDVSVSMPDKGVAFYNDQLDSELRPIYDKLFWGNNLRAVTPKGEHYIPEWSQEELRSLARVLTLGLDMFRSCVHNWASGAKSDTMICPL